MIIISVCEIRGLMVGKTRHVRLLTNYVRRLDKAPEACLNELTDILKLLRNAIIKLLSDVDKKIWFCVYKTDIQTPTVGDY